MDGRLSWLGCKAMERLGVELATSRSQVRRPNHYNTKPPECVEEEHKLASRSSDLERFLSVDELIHGWFAVVGGTAFDQRRRQHNVRIQR